MRAVAVRRPGDAPELLEVPKPAPGPGEVLVRLAAAGVNPYDWKILDGSAEADLPHVYPLIAGVDGAGTVEAAGPGVARFELGERIFGQFFHPPVGTGTYAEYVAAPESLGLAVIPPGMSALQAAAVPTAGMMSLHALDVLGLANGESLLITGAAGGIGSYATQLARQRGLRAIAIARGPQRDYLQTLGAHRFFDATAPSFRDEVHHAFPEGVDALLDLHERGRELAATARLVKKGGRVVSTIGAVDPAAPVAADVRAENVNLQPTVELLERLGREFAAGRLQIPLDQTLPLAEGPRVLAESKAGTLRGKTVLTP